MADISQLGMAVLVSRMGNGYWDVDSLTRMDFAVVIADNR